MEIKSAMRAIRDGWKRSGVHTLAFAAVLCLVGSPVLAQQTEVEKKLEEMEKELQEIKERVRKGQSVDKRIENLEKEMQEIKVSIKEDAAADGKSKGFTEEQKAKGKEKLAASDHVNYSAEWNLGLPKGYVPDRGWMPIFEERSEIRLSGGIQAPSSFNNTFTGIGTLGYALWEKTLVALEYFYGHRENFDGQSGHNNRISLVLRHNFNR
jgi:hypothetical protein